MALQVTVGRARRTDVEGVRLVTVTVVDEDHPAHRAVFTYLAGWTSALVLGDLALPPEERARATHRRPARRIELRSVNVELTPEIPTAMHTAGLTISDVRDLPLARWEAAARAHVDDHPLFAEAPGTVTDEADSSRQAKATQHLREVAARYRAEQRKGTPDPAAAIAREDGVNRSTVRGWIYRARKAGFLPPTDRRTSSE